MNLHCHSRCLWLLRSLIPAESTFFAEHGRLTLPQATCRTPLSQRWAKLTSGVRPTATKCANLLAVEVLISGRFILNPLFPYNRGLRDQVKPGFRV